MRKLAIFALAFLLVLLPVCVSAQATHSAALTWQAPIDANSTTTYNVYRASATCPTGVGPGSLTFTKIASALTSTNYSDTTITVGNWCYYVTQVTNGVESAAAKTQTLGGIATPSVVTFSITIQ